MSTKQKPDLTKVIFRTDGEEVLAVFPRDPFSSASWFDCTCYAQVGQHSACDPQIVMSSPWRPAKPGQYRDVAQELRLRGYRLAIGQRITRHDDDARKTNWEKTRTSAS